MTDISGVTAISRVAVLLILWILICLLFPLVDVGISYYGMSGLVAAIDIEGRKQFPFR
jgi:hypothetical protein